MSSDPLNFQFLDCLNSKPIIYFKYCVTDYKINCLFSWNLNIYSNQLFNWGSMLVKALSDFESFRKIRLKVTCNRGLVKKLCTLKSFQIKIYVGNCYPVTVPGNNTYIYGQICARLSPRTMWPGNQKVYNKTWIRLSTSNHFQDLAALTVASARQRYWYSQTGTFQLYRRSLLSQEKEEDLLRIFKISQENKNSSIKNPFMVENECEMLCQRWRNFIL